MWTPTITSVTRQGRNVVAEISFEQDGEIRKEVARGDDITLERLGIWCKSVVASFEAGDNAYAELKSNEGRTVAISAEEKPADAFFSLRAQAAALQKAVESKLSTDQAGLDAMNTELKATFVPEFLEDPRWG